MITYEDEFLSPTANVDGEVLQILCRLAAGSNYKLCDDSNVRKNILILKFSPCLHCTLLENKKVRSAPVFVIVGHFSGFA